MTFETIVYILCLLTSSLCAWQLVSKFLARRQKLLLWSGICFCLLALNNLLVIVDLVLLPEVDLSLWRALSALLAGCVLLYGFIWEVE
jgi:hypothetical protein